jgi:hypothetical protein
MEENQTGKGGRSIGSRCVFSFFLSFFYFPSFWSSLAYGEERKTSAISWMMVVMAA